MSSSAKPSVDQGVLARRATRVLDPTFPPADGLVGPLLRKTPLPGATFLRPCRQSCMGSHAPRPVRSSGIRSVHWPIARFSWADLDPLPIPRNIFSSGTKSCRGPLSPGNTGCQLHEKRDVYADASDCSRTSGVERITGWGLVRTHAAGAARVLPRPASPRPLGASLLAVGAPPDAGLLGAAASRAHARRGLNAVS